MSVRVQMISRRVRKQYPKLKFTIETNVLGFPTFNFKNFTMTLIDEMSWGDIERFIEKNTKEKTYECIICCDKNYALVPCNKCSNDICMRCFANILEKNDGLMKCPFCLIETGFKQPKKNVLQMRDNILIKNFEINKKMNNLVAVL
jgi:hypothetical protein